MVFPKYYKALEMPYSLFYNMKTFKCPFNPGSKSTQNMIQPRGKEFYKLDHSFLNIRISNQFFNITKCSYTVKQSSNLRKSSVTLSEKIKRSYTKNIHFMVNCLSLVQCIGLQWNEFLSYQLKRLIGKDNINPVYLNGPSLIHI